MKTLKQSNGFTLIELLAALTILSIVLISFFNIYSQSLSHSRIVEDQLTASNVAEKVLTKIIRNKEYSTSYEVNGKIYYTDVDDKITQTVNEDLLGLQRVCVKIYTKDRSKPDAEIYGYLKLEGK